MSKYTGVTYRPDIAKCNFDNCRNQNNNVNGYFVVLKDGKRMNVCEDCILKIPSLMFWSRTSINKIRKKYKIRGKFLRHKSGKYPTNHYKLKRKDPLLKTLKDLKKQGFRMPIFGRRDKQIAVRENQNNHDIDDKVNLTVKLFLWKDQRNNKIGYEIRPI